MKKKLKIAIFCTNEWPTLPPQNVFYAPLWIAYYTAEGLAQKGHDVFYFGSKESKLKRAKLVSFNTKAIKKDKKLEPFLSKSNELVVNFYEQKMISMIYQMHLKEKFDIIHIHPFRRCLPMAPFTQTPTVITIHDQIAGINKLQLAETKNIPQIKLISISNAQRKPLPNLNYVATVYNGIDINKFKYREKPEDYFVAAGRFVPEKGIDIAIDIAKKAGVKLKIAGGPSDGDYFNKLIKPKLSKNIEYVGMIDYLKMGDFYSKAKALIAPIQWEEPFGLFFTEAMACGTPVIAYNRGSVPEVIKDKKTGFIVKNVSEAVKAVYKIDQIKRSDCRDWVKERFSIDTMVDGYEKAYFDLIQKKA
ncbi:MAG TPA: glycosyltransferase family 4 protein [Candidatus Pacearchaeota archaeon]|nr:glycosyltransferase family 4 protein [Candidatus Pacearchaeota archaeon]